MIKVSVFYPRQPAATFDMTYYLEHHIPMVRDKLGAACKGITVDKGLAGGTPQSEPTYSTMAHLLFDSVATFQAAFGPHATEIMADVPNYSNVAPVIQISDVKI